MLHPITIEKMNYCRQRLEENPELTKEELLGEILKKFNKALSFTKINIIYDEFFEANPNLTPVKYKKGRNLKPIKKEFAIRAYKENPNLTPNQLRTLILAKFNSTIRLVTARKYIKEFKENSSTVLIKNENIEDANFILISYGNIKEFKNRDELIQFIQDKVKEGESIKDFNFYKRIKPQISINL